MNGINSLDNPTINGLRSLALDELNSSHINTESLYLANIETNDVTIDDALILENGAVIFTNGQTITDTELSYLDGTSSNIESRFITDESNISQNATDILALEGKTQNISAIAGTTTVNGTIVLSPGSDISANNVSISDTEISYLNGVSSNIQIQINSVVDYSSEITTLENKTAYIASASGNITEFDNAILLDEIYFNAGGFIDFIDDTRQYSAFTNAHKQKLDDTTLINSSNKLDAQLIGTGVVDNTEFNYLNGVSSGIQT